MAGRLSRTRLALAATAILVVLTLALTLERVPTPYPDVQLYASIARSWQLHGIGIPSVLWNSPDAVDHIPFYGPVFFSLVATSFRFLGVSIGSARIVSLLGAILFASAGAMLARLLSGAANGWLWAFTLLLLTPELGDAATSGAMDTIAVGLETMALAVFVRGLVIRRHQPWHGAGAALLLTLAMLTTPRTYPFVCGFAAAVALCGVPAERRRAVWTQSLTALLVLVAGVSAWATVSQGNPIRWVRYIAFILMREDSDVAVLPTAIRQWSFHWSAIITPAFAVIGAVVAAGALSRQGRHGRDDDIHPATFALVTGWITLVATICVMNLTFTCGIYFALPLVAVVLAIPFQRLSIAPGVLAGGVTALLICDAGVIVVKYARVATTWAARDPRPLDAFVRAHVPAGSAVIGPQGLYFFPSNATAPGTEARRLRARPTGPAGCRSSTRRSLSRAA